MLLLHTTHYMAHVSTYDNIYTSISISETEWKPFYLSCFRFGCPPSRRTSIVLIFGWFDKCYELSSVVGKGSITTAKNANQIENEDGEHGILSFFSSSSYYYYYCWCCCCSCRCLCMCNRIGWFTRNRENYLTAIEMISLIEMIEPQKRKATQCLFRSPSHAYRMWTIQRTTISNVNE